VDWLLIVVGLLFVAWPIYLRRAMRRVRDRVVARGTGPTSIDAVMARRSMRWTLTALPVVGVAFVVLGIVGV
jgi:uncharacterized RDD family membrane protein YckC